MEFTISKQSLQKELGFLQGVVEKRNTIPQLGFILLESAGDNRISLTATDLDITARTEAEAEISTPGAVAIHARKLLDVSKLLPDAPVKFRQESNDWVTVSCLNYRSKLPGNPRDRFPEVPGHKSAPTPMPAQVFRGMIERSIFAITQEESRYTLSGAKFILNKTGARMITTDGHRMAFVERKECGSAKDGIDALIPRKALAELLKLTADFEGEIKLGADSNHLYFEVGPRVLISRTLAGQFPNYEMVIPKGNDKTLKLDCAQLNQVIRRVALMAEDRTNSVRLHVTPGQLLISSQSAEEGEASEEVAVEYQGDAVEIGFNAQYLQDFLTVVNKGEILFEFKDHNSQAQMRPVEAEGYDYKYICMPMRL